MKIVKIPEYECSGGEYSLLSDEELVKLGQDGDADSIIALFFRYKQFANLWAKRFFLNGSEKEDLIQEAMIGLFKAIRDFRRTQGIPFFSFARMCVRRHLISCLKQANRDKHMPLNTSISLEKPVYGSEGTCFLDVISNKSVMDPEQLYCEKEQLSQIKNKLYIILSKFELEVFLLYSQGYTYKEMAQELGVSDKSISNSVYRVQNKLKNLSFDS